MGRDLLDHRVIDAVMFGGDDMSADLSADITADVTGYARSVLLTQAAAAAIPVIDSPFFNIADSDGLGKRSTTPLPRDSPERRRSTRRMYPP